MTTRFCLPLLGVLAAACAGAQAPAATAPAAVHASAERVDSSLNALIRAEGFQKSRVMRTAIMLSDVNGPRLAGSPEYMAAANWAVKELNSYGAKAALEPWGKRRGKSWQVVRHSVEMVSPYYARLVAYPKAWSPPTAGTVRGIPQMVAIRADSDLVKYKGKLRGSILLNGTVRPDTAARFAPLARRFTDRYLDSLSRLIDPGQPRTYWDDAGGYAEAVARSNRRAAAIRDEGAAVLLQPSGVYDAVAVTGYQAYDSDVSGTVPAFVVDRGDYQRVINLLEHNVPVTLEISLETRVAPTDSVGYNVIAEIPGTDPELRDEVVMLGAHFDGFPLGTNATDNAAGSAVAIEVMRIIQAIGARPRRTIRLALWDGEEHEEYWGSLGYVKKHFGDPATMKLLPDHGKVSAYFNFDNGTGRIRGIYMQGNTAVRPIFRSFLDPFSDLGASTLTIINKGSTDHMPFVSVGIPAFTFIQDPIDYETRTHHTNRDVAAYLLEDDLKQAAVVTASVVLHTANRDNLLPRLPLPAVPPASGR
jgi:carboxypeptidase Q